MLQRRSRQHLPTSVRRAPGSLVARDRARRRRRSADTAGLGHRAARLDRRARRSGAAPGAPRRGGRRTIPSARPGDPAAIERGKALYGVNCALLPRRRRARRRRRGPTCCARSSCSNDQKGELIGPVVQNGRPGRGMPKFDFTDAQVADIAAFIHSFTVGGYDVSRMRAAEHRRRRREGGRGLFTATLRVVPFARPATSRDSAAKLRRRRRCCSRRG